MSLSDGQEVTLDKGFYGEKAVNLGKSGSGKSYGARVLVEEGREHGITFLIIDPQDAHGNYPGFEYVHIKSVKDAKKYGMLVAKTGVCVVIRTKGESIERQQMFVKQFLEGYRKNVRKGIQYIIIDEAHKFAPEQSNPPSKEEVRALFQENRSDGVGALAISQRPARLDKTVLSQADHLMLFRVTSHADKEAIRGYLDDPNDLDKVKVLPKGSCYLSGFGHDEPIVVKVRTAKTEHTGNSPEHLISSHPDVYHQAERKFLHKRNNTMSETIPEKGDLVHNLVPGKESFMKLAGIGAGVGLGLAGAGLASAAIGSVMPSWAKVPGISNRTVVSAATTIALYGTYRMIPEKHEMVSEIAKYAAAGSAIFTAGSLVVDGLNAVNVTVPGSVGKFMQAATGVAPAAGGSAQKAGVDVDTAFA